MSKTTLARSLALAVTLASMSLLAFSCIAHASSIESETSLGADDWIEALNFQSEVPHDDDSGGWSWTLGLNYNHAKASAPNSSAQVADPTSEFTGGLSWGRAFEGGAGFTYSKTPLDSLSSFGPTAFIGYTYRWGTFKSLKSKTFKGKPASLRDELGADLGDSESKSFEPNVHLKIGTGVVKYSQTLSTKKQTVLKQSYNEIIEGSANLEASVSPFEWGSLKGTYTRYSYNRPVVDFLSSLSKSKGGALRSFKTGGFANVVSGFSSSQSELEVELFPIEEWEFALTGTYSVNEADGTIGRGVKGVVSKDVGEQWRVGLGAERDTSTVTSQTLGLVILNYEL